MNFQVVRENALKYLGYQAPMFEGLTPGISSLLGECIEEIKQIAQPKVIVKRFKLAKDPLRLEESGDEILGQQMEDILEEIVGNIFDEYDESEEFIQPQFDESILMDGLTPLDDVEEVLGIDLGDHAFETLNGYLTSLLGHIPTAEDKEINANGYCFQILSVEDNIIQKIRVEKIQ